MKGLLAILQVLIWFPLVLCFFALGYNIVVGMFRSTTFLAKVIHEKGSFPANADIERIVKAQYWSRYGQWLVGIVFCMGAMVALRILDKLIS